MTTRTTARTTARTTPSPAPGADPARATRAQLLEAARLGAAVAQADLAGEPGTSAAAYASWRRLRRRSPRRPRQLLRVAFDTGYGRAMQGAGATPR